MIRRNRRSLNRRAGRALKYGRRRRGFALPVVLALLFALLLGVATFAFAQAGKRLSLNTPASFLVDI